jgi:hypothetical protein
MLSEEAFETVLAAGIERCHGVGEQLFERVGRGRGRGC